MINLNLAKLVLIELILEQTNKLKQGEDAQWEEDKESQFTPYFKRLCSYFPKSEIRELDNTVEFTIYSKGLSTIYPTEESWDKLTNKIREDLDLVDCSAINEKTLEAYYKYLDEQEESIEEDTNIEDDSNKQHN